MPARLLLLLAALAASLLLLPAGTAPGAAAGKRAKRCPAGKVPVTGKRGRAVAVKRDRRGRLRCRAIPVGAPPAPAAAPLGQAADVTDALRRTAAIDPAVTAPLRRTLGQRRASALLDVALDGWHATAGVARARAATSTQAFVPSAGVAGSVSFGVEDVGGADSGFVASAAAEVTATREGIATLSPEAKEKLPPDVTGAKGRVEVRFEDRIAKCPPGSGGRAGRVKASGKVTVTVEREGKPPVTMELEATVETSYVAQAGADGKVTTIDKVDTQTSFRSSATGQATQTYRGRRVGSGFGRASILGSSDLGGAIGRDVGHFDAGQGGTFGPKGAWNYERGIGLQDLRSIDNVKAMLTTAIATDLLTLATLEYVRKLVLERAEKEKCGGSYTVTIDVSGRAAFATHDATGRWQATVAAAPAGDATARRWAGSAPAGWTGLAYTTRVECPLSALPGGGTVSVEIVPAGEEAIQVTWTTDVEGGRALAAIDCPPEGDPPYDPPPIPGLPGPSLTGISPTTFRLPSAGGTQAIGGGFAEGADGFFSDGSVTVTRAG